MGTVGICRSCSKNGEKVPVEWCDACPDWECKNCRCAIDEKTVEPVEDAEDE